MTSEKNQSSRTNFIASVTLLGLLSILEIFHLLILLKVIPFDFIWGGKLKSSSQMLLFETVSVITNSLMILIVAISGEIIKSRLRPIIIKVALWVMFLLFILNTMGNFTSENPFEKNVFTPITLLISLLCLMLIFTKKYKKLNTL
ncbi:MAG: hypothetical protein JWR61_3533 [Ferruginibacter sp.]|nr:hypothetical protein [Ferruginibacter sp.]